jgi:hypothetical protein
MLVAFALNTLGCKESEAPPAEPPALPPAEVFTWGGQPISFSPPPAGWRREKEQSNGLRGARFVLSGSVGERIHVAEHYALDDRDRCARLAALASDHENLDDHAFRNDLLRARPHAPEPINGWEARFAADANSSLDSAFEARMQDDPAMTQYWLDRSREEAAQIRYTLDDVVDRVTFEAPVSPAAPRFEVGERTPTTVAGEPAYALNYVMHLSGREYLGREYYVLKNNRLFVASFQGLPENLGLFEQVVKSITFPPGECDHEG